MSLIKNISRNNYLMAIGIFTALGVAGGYAYYYFVGCNNGCAIQSNPYLSMVWGGAIGYLLPGMVISTVPKKNTNDKEEDSTVNSPNP